MPTAAGDAHSLWSPCHRRGCCSITAPGLLFPRAAMKPGVCLGQAKGVTRRPGRREARPRVWEPPGPAGVASGPRPAWRPGLCCLRGFRSVTRSLPQRGRKLGRGTKTPFTVSFQSAGGKARVPCEAEPAQRETAREPRLAATLATRVTSGRSPRKTSVGFLPPSAGAFNETRSRERERFQAGFRPRRRYCHSRTEPPKLLCPRHPRPYAHLRLRSYRQHREGCE